MMGRPRTAIPLSVDQPLGVTLYGPTASNPSFRVVYTDPFTGQRVQSKRRDQADAEALYHATLNYLRSATRTADAGTGGSSGKGVRTLDDLFDAQVNRWEDDDRSDLYITRRIGMYEMRISPDYGSLPVRAWAASTENCRNVLKAVRDDGRKPATVENYGVLMRGLVTLAWDLRWISDGDNPMRGVKYRRRSTQQGQKPEFVDERDRPDFEAVERLIDSYEQLAEETGISWLPLRAMVGAFSGPRPSERDALQIRDVTPDELAIQIRRSFVWSRQHSGRVIGPTKSGMQRTALTTRSIMERLTDHIEQLRASGAADDALLFADPLNPGRPLSTAKSRRLHIEAAARAGWETVAVRRQQDAKRHLGPDHRPRHTDYSLRHHAATWMHHRAGFPWEDVSRYLGHQSVSFTLDTYVHSGAGADARNRQRLASM